MIRKRSLWRLKDPEEYESFWVVTANVEVQTKLVGPAKRAVRVRYNARSPFSRWYLEPVFLELFEEA